MPDVWLGVLDSWSHKSRHNESSQSKSKLPPPASSSSNPNYANTPHHYATAKKVGTSTRIIKYHHAVKNVISTASPVKKEKIGFLC